MKQYEIELRDKVALAVMLSPEPMYDLHDLSNEQVIKYAFNIAYKFMDERKQWGKEVVGGSYKTDQGAATGFVKGKEELKE